MIPTLILTAFAFVPCQEEGTLARMKKGAKGDDKKQEQPPPSPTDVDPRYERTSSPVSDAWAEGTAEAIAWFLSYPFCNHGLRYDDFPFANGPGYFRESGRPLAFEADWKFGRVEHDLTFNEISLTMRLPSGFDFTYDVSRYVETGLDTMTLQEIQFNYGPGAPGRNFQWTVGWGIAILGFDDFTDSALTLQATFTCFPSAPWRFEGRFVTMGFTNMTLTDIDVSFGWHVDRLSLTAGYRSLITSGGGPELNGPTIGLSIYF